MPDIEIKKSMDFVSDSFQMAIKKRVEWLKENPPHLPLAGTPQEGNFHNPALSSSQEVSVEINFQGVSEELFNDAKSGFIPNKPLEFSMEARTVFEAGRKLWSYYHQKHSTPQEGNFGTNPGYYNPNASLYDIKAYFQGRNDKGKMNNKSTDQEYNILIKDLRESLKILAQKIQPKVYEYGFLRE